MTMNNKKEWQVFLSFLKFCVYLQVNNIDSQATSAKVLTPVAICKGLIILHKFVLKREASLTTTL